MRKFKKSLIKNREYFIFFILLIVFLFIKLLSISDPESKILLTNTLDFSWNIDMVERFLHGFIAGRDFIFTYGPLYQFISSLPSILLSVTSYQSVLISPLILLLLSGLNFLIIFAFLTKNKREQVFLSLILTLLFGLTGIILPNDLLRSLLPMLFGVVFYKFIYSAKRITSKNIFILLIPSILGTYIFDLFITCFLIATAFLLFQLLKDRGDQKSLKKTIISLVIVFLAEICASIIISGNSNYLFSSLSTVLDYKYIMNIPLSLNKSYFLFIFPLILFLSLILLIRKKHKILKNSFLISLCLTSFFGLGQSIVRTDEGHILSSVIPSLIALVALVYFSLENNKRMMVGFLLFLALVILKSNSVDTFRSISLSNLSMLLSKNLEFFDIYKLPSDYYLTDYDFEYLSKLINENPGKVMIYPYDNYLLNISHQTFNTYLLQFYDYSNSKSEQKAVDMLTIFPPKFIIYAIDDSVVPRLDNIPNHSRNSILTKWLINNYSVHKNKGTYLVLKHDTSGKKFQNINCNLSSLSSKNIKRDYFFEDLIKPSTYYIESDNGLRLPFTNKSADILFFAEYSNAKSMENLINSNVDYDRFTLRKGDFRIIKKYSLPNFTKTISEFEIKCYL